MTPLGKALEEYLSIRRGLGFKLKTAGDLLQGFISFMEKEGASRITTDLAVRWAKLPSEAQPAWWAMRLRAVRHFARHLSASDPRTEVPSPQLLQTAYGRKTPYLYTDRQVSQLIRSARQISPRAGFKRWTYPTLFGLLSVTGLRIREVLRLDRDAVDLEQGVLTIRGTKFGKTRWVPLHPSTQHALRRYVRRRDKVFPRPKTSAFFVSDRGTPITLCAVRWNFLKLSVRIGLRGPSDRQGPRLHDFRHRFAVQTLLGWYRAGKDVDRLMPVLSTYLGHVKIAGTYWYLTAVPELFRLVSTRLEKSLGGLP